MNAKAERRVPFFDVFAKRLAPSALRKTNIVTCCETSVQWDRSCIAIDYSLLPAGDGPIRLRRRRGGRVRPRRRPAARCRAASASLRWPLVRQLRLAGQTVPRRFACGTPLLLGLDPGLLAGLQGRGGATRRRLERRVGNARILPVPILCTARAGRVGVPFCSTYEGRTDEFLHFKNFLVVAGAGKQT